MIKQLISISFLLISGFLFAEKEFDWGWAASTTNENGIVTYGETVTDLTGNSYIIGSYGSEEFTLLDSTVTNRKYGVSLFNQIAGSFPTYIADAFVAKINLNGELIWMKTFGGNGDDHGLSIDVNNTGEIVLLFSSSGDEVDFEGTELNLTTKPSGKYASIVVKLNANGSLNKLSEVNMTNSRNVSNGKLRIEEDNIYIQTSFFSFASSIEINDSTIASDFAFNLELLIALSFNDLSIQTFKQLGNPYTSGTFTNTFSEVQKVKGKWVILGSCTGDGISFDDWDLVFQGDAKKYMLSLNLDGSVSNLFELDENSFVQFTANENGIVITSDQNPNTINDDLFHVDIYKYDGTLIKTHSFINTVNHTPIYSIDNMIVDDNGNLTIALSFQNKFGIDGTEYNVIDSVQTTTEYDRDLLLLAIDTVNFDYNSYYINGNYYNETCLDLVLSNDKLILIGEHGSTITIGENELLSEGRIDFSSLHGELSGERKITSLFLTELDVLSDVLGLTNTSKPISNSIYPNPAVNSFSISEEIEGEIEIYNLQGNKILTLENSVSEINFELQKGSYIVKFLGKNSQVYSESLIVE